MAYIRKEELPARHIGNRLIPPLTKCYRADGSFDLFDMANAPFNVQWLCQRKYAGYRCIRCNGTLNIECSFGEYSNAGEGYSGTINTVYLDYYASSGKYGGAACTSVLKLMLDNPLGLTPSYLWVQTGANGDDDNAGATIIRTVDYNDAIIMNKYSGSRGSSQTWDNRSNLPLDYKDVKYIWAGTGTRGGGKFPGGRIWANYRFITRLPYCNEEIYRIYS